MSIKLSIFPQGWFKKIVNIKYWKEVVSKQLKSKIKYGAHKISQHEFRTFCKKGKKTVCEKISTPLQAELILLEIMYRECPRKVETPFNFFYREDK